MSDRLPAPILLLVIGKLLEVLNKIRPRIEKRNTVMKDAIGLSATLGFSNWKELQRLIC